VPALPALVVPIGENLIASEVRPSDAETIVEALIREAGFERIELRIAPDNVASLRVAEKSGFTREGIARNAGFTDAGRIDLVIWSLVPADL